METNTAQTPAAKKITVAVARKAIAAAGGDPAKFEQDGKALEIWCDTPAQERKTEAILRRAAKWLTANGYGTAASMISLGHYRKLDWSRFYSSASWGLICQNID